MRQSWFDWADACLGAAFICLTAGCTLTPKDARQHREQLAEIGKAYEAPIQHRELPDLPDQPTWRDVLERAFLANGGLEAAYFQWKAAVERINIAGAWPNSDVALGYSYMFSSQRMNTFDRMTFSAAFDPSVNLSWPSKTMQAARVALSEAKAAGERFRVAKFELQRQVLNAWADYTLQAQMIALRKQDIALRELFIQSTYAGIRTGARQIDALAADVSLQMFRSQLLDLESEHQSTRASLNALMERDPRAPLNPALSYPVPRPVPDDDAALLAAAADVFPEVAEFAQDVQSRRDALELARLRWIPDFSPTLALTGGIAQAVGLSITLPTTIAAIRAQIQESQAMLRRSEALLRQRQFDRIGEYVSLLVMLRNAQRQQSEFSQRIGPAAQRIADLQQQAYTAGATNLRDVIESRRTLLEVQLTIAQAQATIEKATVEIECCLGTDLGTISNKDSDRPATQPENHARQPHVQESGT
jgi:cobalt-zinc-cadmium efflux system outer membrane protein